MEVRVQLYSFYICFSSGLTHELPLVDHNLWHALQRLPLHFQIVVLDELHDAVFGAVAAEQTFPARVEPHELTQIEARHRHLRGKRRIFF